MDNRTLAKYALVVVQEAIHVLDVNSEKIETVREIDGSNQIEPSFQRNAIYNALFSISPTLANSYEQVKNDILDSSRLSWAGTAHEVREIISNLLRMLAPDADVRSKSWFKQDPTAKGITQTQRARYILQLRQRGSTTLEVVERDVNLLDERISELVRSTYNRASNAAHTYEDQKEVEQILGYFEVLVQDLIEVKGK